jgi:hypothetical protein
MLDGWFYRNLGFITVKPLFLRFLEGTNPLEPMKKHMETGFEKWQAELYKQVMKMYLEMD